MERADFITEATETQLRRERSKARALRQSQWWKRKRAAGVCYYCGRQVGARKLTMDHMVPVIRGGRSTRGNVVPACKACNTAKQLLLPVEWEEYLRRLADSSRGRECTSNESHIGEREA
ncbi:MAG: HNH endonuclease [Candidatus Methylomirabilia bacterium]